LYGLKVAWERFSFSAREADKVDKRASRLHQQRIDDTNKVRVSFFVHSDEICASDIGAMLLLCWLALSFKLIVTCHESKSRRANRAFRPDAAHEVEGVILICWVQMWFTGEFRDLLADRFELNGTGTFTKCVSCKDISMHRLETSYGARVELTDDGRACERS
jgi:hypothetical protein